MSVYVSDIELSIATFFMIFRMRDPMVESSVEYVDKDVEAAATDEEETNELMAWELAAVLKLVIPVVSTVFVMLYLNSVVGRIAISNLYYPLFVITALLALLLTVYIEELRDVYRSYVEYDISVRTELMSLLDEWKQSIGLLVVSIAYLYVIPVLGFFSASVIAMIIIMPLGGYRDWRIIVGTTIGILVLIYVLFVVVANLQPPEGLLI